MTSVAPLLRKPILPRKNPKFFSNLIFKQRVICHFDSLCLKPTDLGEVTNIVRSRNLGMITFLIPSRNLQELVHPRFEVEDMAIDQATGTPYGILTAIVSEFSPSQKSKKSLFERLFEPEWIPQLVLKTSVIDRHTWNRTAWHFRSYLKSSQWQDFPRKVYGLDLRPDPVSLAGTKFNEEKDMFESFKAECPNIGFKLGLEDTGVSVLDPDARVVDGFVDNESALRVIIMHRESLMRGNEGTCFRTGVWSTPVIPNVANVTDFSIGRQICDLFELPEDQFPVDSPLCAWCVKDIPSTFVYQAESTVEDENEPNDWTDQNEKTYTDRAQRKAMNRNHEMKDEIRMKAYRDMGFDRAGKKVMK